ncbi:hypothetical protein, partial [Bifidobacterium biavatii]
MDADQNGVSNAGLRRMRRRWSEWLRDVKRQSPACLTRPIPALLCVAAAVFVVAEWPAGMAVYGADAVPWWLCTAMTVALLGSAASPRIGSLAVCLLFALTAAAPWLNAGMFHLSVMAAVFNAAVTSGRRWRWGCYALAVAGSSFEAMRAAGGGGVAMLTNQSVMYAIPLFVAYALRTKERALRAEREVSALRARQAETERLRQQFELSRRIHDSLSGALSYIALRAECADDADAALADIRGQAMHGLDDVHRIIRMMRDDGRDAGHGSGAGSADSADVHGRRNDDAASLDRDAASLRSVVDRGSGMLDSLGFRGAARIDGMVPDGLLRSAGAIEAASLAEELLSNIVRHGKRPGGEWYMEIRVGRDAVHVTQTNEIGDGGRSWSGGTGLRAHAAIIARLGGSLRHSVMDGSWFVSADIPWRAASPPAAVL